MTSVFFILMVSPKISQTDEHLSMFRCTSSSELAFYSAIISKQNVTHSLLLYASSGLQYSQIKQLAIIFVKYDVKLPALNNIRREHVEMYAVFIPY